MIKEQYIIFNLWDSGIWSGRSFNGPIYAKYFNTEEDAYFEIKENIGDQFKGIFEIKKVHIILKNNSTHQSI